VSFEAEWARCSDWLAAALKRADDGRDLDEARSQVLADLAQFWPFDRCAFVTEVLETPDGRTLHIWLGGGDLKEMAAHQETLAEWARAAGCRYATINGRRGWMRALRGFSDHDGEFRRIL
jgi:hypothetical protein